MHDHMTYGCLLYEYPDIMHELTTRFGTFKEYSRYCYKPSLYTFSHFDLQDPVCSDRIRINDENILLNKIHK